MMNNEEFVEKQADFTLKFLHQTQLKGLKSTVLSPIFISIGLAALNKVNKDVVNKTGNQDKIVDEGDESNPNEQNFENLWKEMQALKLTKCQLNAINRIYIKDGFNLDKKVVENLKNCYGEDIIHQLEFNEDERIKINNSLEVLTNKLMPEIIPLEGMDPSAQIFLINAAHFYGKWKQPFSPKGPFSTPKKFYVTRDIVRYVDFMHTPFEPHLYEKTDNYKVVGLEYADDCTMFIVLPKERFGLSEIIGQLNGTDLIKLSKNKSKNHLTIFLPRFSCNTHIDAVDILKSKETKGAINSLTADFSNLYKNDNSLGFQHFFHQSIIEVNEKGNEKDFAYSRSPYQSPGGPSPYEKLNFTADHPFLYFISDKHSNILFIGTVIDDFQPDFGETFSAGPRLFRFLTETPEPDNEKKQEIPLIKLKLDDKQQIINPFLKSGDTNEFEKYVTNEWLLAQVKKLTFKIVNRVILKEETKIANVYSGLGGIVFALLKAQKYFYKKLSDEVLDICKQYMKAQHFATNVRTKPYYMYLDGSLGLHVVNAILSITKNESFDMSKMIKIIAAQKYSQPDTIRKGRCGLLAGLLTLQLETNTEIMLDENEIREFLTKIIKAGHEYSQEHSLEVPLGYPENNLGFLNGLSGILQMLLSFWDYLDDTQKASVKNTVDWLFDKNDEAEPPANKRKDSTEEAEESFGKCQLFIVAYIVFGDQKYLNAADTCCNKIWESGILDKNPGLDNGLSGNGYAFLLMYRLTKDEKFLIKAKLFALILMNTEYEKHISAESEDSFGIFNGWAGALCFLTDLMNPQNAQFPFIPISFIK